MYDTDFNRFEAHRNGYVDAIIGYLRIYRYLELAPENLFVRVIFRDLSDFDRDPNLDIANYAQDMLVDSVRYLDDVSFRLTLSACNFRLDDPLSLADDLDPPMRIPDTQLSIVVRRNGGTAPPYVSAFFLHPVKCVIERTAKLISGELSAVDMKPFALEELEHSSFLEELAPYFNFDDEKVC